MDRIAFELKDDCHFVSYVSNASETGLHFIDRQSSRLPEHFDGDMLNEPVLR